MTGLPKNDDGTYQAFAWPGGYPIYYLFADGEVCCPSCANGQNGSLASETTDDKQWRLVAAGVNDEDDNMICSHCGGKIESSYGDLDESESDNPQEGDYTTMDHIHFYCDGKLVLTIPEGEEEELYLSQHFEEEGYYPNIWFISDHGNAHQFYVES